MFANLAKPSNHKLRAMLARETQRLAVRMPSGVILPDQFVVNIDRQRLIRWCERLFRGLFYHECGHRLPPNYEISVALGEDLPAMVQECVAWFRTRPLRKSGDGIVEYKWASHPEKPEASVWCLEFYHCAVIIGIVHPPFTDEEKDAAMA